MNFSKSKTKTEFHIKFRDENNTFAKKKKKGFKSHINRTNYSILQSTH